MTVIHTTMPIQSAQDATTTPSIVTAHGVTHRYGRTPVLRDVHINVPEGAVYALLGANGAGKSTLLRLLAGIEPLQGGAITLDGVPVQKLSVVDRQRICYVAEGQKLPDWMRLEQLEAFCAPLYPSWDFDLAAHLRRRFALDAKQKLGTMSRGQRMKAALLCALAPRPRLLLMDEPFTGLDVAVKEELIGGLLESAGTDGWSLVIATHDVDEIERFVDHVGFLRDGVIGVAGVLESLRDSLVRVELTFANAAEMPRVWPEAWRQLRPVEQAGLRVSAVVTRQALENEVALLAQAGTHEVRPLSLREMYMLFGAAVSGDSNARHA